jgi:hypothetical protein
LHARMPHMQHTSKTMSRGMQTSSQQTVHCTAAAAAQPPAAMQSLLNWHSRGCLAACWLNGGVSHILHVCLLHICCKLSQCCFGYPRTATSPLYCSDTAPAPPPALPSAPCCSPSSTPSTLC